MASVRGDSLLVHGEGVTMACSFAVLNQNINTKLFWANPVLSNRTSFPHGLPLLIFSKSPR